MRTHARNIMLHTRFHHLQTFGCTVGSQRPRHSDFQITEAGYGSINVNVIGTSMNSGYCLMAVASINVLHGDRFVTTKLVVYVAGRDTYPSGSAEYLCQRI